MLLTLAALMAAGWSLALADESIEPTEDDDHSIVVLQPGHNYVGWVGAPLSVAELMRRIPEITAVRAWDARLQRSYSPSRLSAGMGVRITLDSDGSVSWRRSMAPVKGRVDLRRGRNLVSWGGSDGTTVSEAVRGVGISLTEASRAGGGNIVNRGDAVWVTVTRDIIWLQPTGILPVVKFPGGASREVRSRVMDSLDYTLRFFRETFAIEADFSSFIVYVPKDGDSLIAMLRDDFPDRHLREGSIRGDVEQGTAWVENGAPYTVLPQLMWTEVRDPAYGEENPVWRGQFVTAHEYTHVLQAQLRGLDLYAVSQGTLEDGKLSPPTWMVEGNAMWVMDAVHVQDGVDDWSAAWREAVADVISYNTLREQGEQRFYPLGRLATLFLSGHAGAEAWVELWRQLAPNSFGPGQRYSQRPYWEQAFETAFGMSLDTFHEAFERERRNWGRQVSGRVVLDDGFRASIADAPAFTGLDVVVTGEVETFGSRTRYLSLTTRTDREGLFTTNLGRGSYSLAVNAGDCMGLSREILISHVNITDIVLEMPSCIAISGNLLDSGGNPLANVQVWAYSEDGEGTGGQTASDGSFDFFVPSPGAYRVSARIDGCTVYFGGDDATGDYWMAEQIHVSHVEGAGVVLQMAEGMCEHRVSGKLLNADGTPRPDQWVGANANAGNGGANTAADGSFSFAVPGNGSYRLQVQVGGCWLYSASRGVTTNYWSAREITVSNADVTGIEFRLPEDPSTFCD